MDIVGQMNDYLTTRAKSLRWIMIVLYYMMDTARLNVKVIWCIKNEIDHHKLKILHLWLGSSQNTYNATCHSSRCKWIRSNGSAEKKFVL